MATHDRHRGDQTLEEPTTTQAHRTIPASLSILAYMNCARCLAERPADQTAQEWKRLDVGYTRHGLQVWCVRHDLNVCHIDFNDQRVSDNTYIVDVP